MFKETNYAELTNGNLHLGRLREGIQIEDANVPINDKSLLLHDISDTELKRIVIGSFVSPKWTPQMTLIHSLVKRFHFKKVLHTQP